MLLAITLIGWFSCFVIQAIFICIVKSSHKKASNDEDSDPRLLLLANLGTSGIDAFVMGLSQLIGGRKMLKGIPKILSPDLLKVLCEMGHSDRIVIADGNFPAESIGKTER